LWLRAIDDHAARWFDLFRRCSWRCRGIRCVVGLSQPCWVVGHVMMTSEDAPILCMTRSIGSWIVRLHAVSVPQFVDQCGWPEVMAETAIERLVTGSTVHDTDAETCYCYVSYRPSDVKRQWADFHATDPAAGADACSDTSTQR
jgi:hypothetical protein